MIKTKKSIFICLLLIIMTISTSFGVTFDPNDASLNSLPSISNPNTSDLDNRTQTADTQSDSDTNNAASIDTAKADIQKTLLDYYKRGMPLDKIYPGFNGGGSWNNSNQVLNDIIDKTAKNKLSSMELSNDTELKDAFNKFMSKFKTILFVLSGFGTISSFLIFAFLFINMGAMPSHPIQHRKAIQDMLTSGVSTMLLGSITVFLGMFYNTFNSFTEGGLMYSSDLMLSVNIMFFEYKYIITVFTGLGFITMFLFFIKGFLSLSKGGNPGERSAAIGDLILTGIGTMGLGSLTFFVMFFYNVLG